MCASEESVSVPTCVGRVHIGVGERRETESGRGGVQKGTGEALFDMHDHRGTQREKSNTRNRPKKTTKPTSTVQQKCTVPKQYIVELTEQKDQNKKRKKQQQHDRNNTPRNTTTKCQEQKTTLNVVKKIQQARTTQTEKARTEYLYL